jgi:hypothetical protein
MMLLTLLISRKIIFGGNLSFAQVADVENEGCVLGAGVGECAWEVVYSVDSPSSKPSFAAFTLWSLALVPGDFGGGDERISEGFEEDDQEF